MTDKQIAMDCIHMLETYLDEVKKLPNGSSKMLTLAGQDMTYWKDAYYPYLVQGDKICDGEFFQNPLKNLNYGIGKDGVCTKLEYLHFLWRAYKFVLGDLPSDSEAAKNFKECIDRLEPYTARFENQGTDFKTIYEMEHADSMVWKTGYYIGFCQSGLIPNASYFSGEAHHGIDANGQFYPEELCHFLFRLYRQMYIISR